VLDTLADLSERIVNWSAPTWEVLAVAVGTCKPDREVARVRASQIAADAGRVRLLGFARLTVNGWPCQGRPIGAVQALQDAITAMLLADVLPLDAYTLLTQPLVDAAREAAQAADQLDQLPAVFDAESTAASPAPDPAGESSL
jgi:hypothetical protein